MTKHWCYFLFMFWFSYLIAASILLFTKGFLLSRVTQKNNSSCLQYSDVPCVSGESVTLNITNGHEYHCSSDDKFHLVLNDINSASRICLPKKSNVILLIVDALRYDFAVYNPSLKNPFAFQNKLPIIRDLLEAHPSSSRLYKFIADPPTTTLQRLNALTTGSLPTFIDAGSNFATSEINEDNLIDQLLKHEHKIVFMGDDTWSSLYPNRFARSYPFPSFNVWDLDTVDEGNVKKLFPELEKKDWSLLIAHFLGVDHCGHRYGSYHQEMSRKLTEMNEVIKNVTEVMDNNTILFVIGDHGMTATGDHGGSSEDEITSAMFVYSKRPLTSQEYEENANIIKQVDLVPTLATILGVPIPFSNLGSLVLGSLPSASPDELLFSLWANVQQVVDYIREYSNATDTFGDEILDGFYKTLSVLRARVHAVKSRDDFLKIVGDVKDYLVNLREMCEEVWVQFDSFSMSRGLVLMFLSTFLVYIIVDGIPGPRLPEIFESSFLLCSYAAVIIAAVISYALYHFSLINNLLLNVYFSTGVISLFMLAMLIVQNWEVISLYWHDRGKNNQILNLFFRLALILSVCGVFSNSYIVEEAYVQLFLLISVIFLQTFSLSSLKPRGKPEKLNFGKCKLLKMENLVVVGIFCLIRLTVNYWKCREEQQWCLIEYKQAKSSDLNRVEWLFALVCLALLITAIKNWLRSCGNLVGLSLPVTLAKYSPTVIIVCMGGFWVLHRLPKSVKHKLLGLWQPDDILARVVFGLIAAGIAVVFVEPLSVYVLPKKADGAPNEANVIPKIFNKVKGLFNERNAGKDGDVPVVYGLATVYSASFINMGLYFTLLLALLLGDGIAPSIVACFLSTLLILLAISIQRLEKMKEIKNLFEIPNLAILTWAIMSHYWFFATGHQPTFPNIPWEAAFVGTGGTITNNYIPGALIILNTFGCYALMGLLLPLLLITPFTLLIMIPSLMAKKKDLLNNFSRGEMMLYEESEEMMNSTFTLCCKYIMCHCIKVFACMLSATIHCRHLMVWKIFAPKLIFESVGLLITLTSVLVGYLLLARVNHKVNRLVISLNKKSS